MSHFIKCYRDFSGGLSELANDQMADNQLAQAQNVAPGKGSGIARCYGTELALHQLPVSGISNHRLDDVLELTIDDGTVQTLAFTLYESGNVTRQNIYKLNSTRDGWVLLSTDQPPLRDRFIYAHKLYWLNSADYQVYDGTTISSLAVTPADGQAATEAETATWNRIKTAVAVEQRGQRWFYATTNNEVIFSELGDPALITPTNVVNVVTRDNDTITALREFNDGLLIFKRHSVHFLCGWDFSAGSDIMLSRLEAESGTQFPRTVRQAEGGVIYLGEHDLYYLSVSKSGVGVSIRNLSRYKLSEALFGTGVPAEAFAICGDDAYYLCVRADTADAPRQEYRYYPALNAFFGPYTQQPCCYAMLDGKLYLGLDNGYIARYDRDSYHYINTTNGTSCAIPLQACTRGFDVADNMAQDVKLKKVLLAAKQYLSQSSHVTLAVKADYSEAEFTLGDGAIDESLVYDEGLYGATFWGWQDVVTRQAAMKTRAKRVTLSLADDSQDEPLLIYGLALVYKKRKVTSRRVARSG